MPILYTSYKNLYKKRFNNRETMRSIRNDQLKSLPFIMICWDNWTKKRINHLSLMEGKCYMKNICWIIQYYGIFVSLMWNFFFYIYLLALILFVKKLFSCMIERHVLNRDSDPTHFTWQIQIIWIRVHLKIQNSWNVKVSVKLN